MMVSQPHHGQINHVMAQYDQAQLVTVEIKTRSHLWWYHTSHNTTSVPSIAALSC